MAIYQMAEEHYSFEWRTTHELF